MPLDVFVNPGIFALISMSGNALNFGTNLRITSSLFEENVNILDSYPRYLNVTGRFIFTFRLNLPFSSEEKLSPFSPTTSPKGSISPVQASINLPFILTVVSSRGVSTFVTILFLRRI